MLHVSIRVTGRVQGVFFRAATRDVATGLGLTGFVRNEADGSVYVEAEGEAEKIKGLISWCKVGPERAKVESVNLTDGEVRGYTSFEIQR